MVYIPAVKAEILRKFIYMSSNLSVALDHVQQAVVCMGGELGSLIHSAGIDAGATVAVAQILNMLQEVVVKLGEIRITP